MWTRLGVENFILKLERVNDEWEVSVSDFVRVWRNSLGRDTVLSVSKKLNPLIEADDSKLIEKVMSLFDQIRSIHKKIEENSNHLTLSLDSNLSGVIFRFKIDLELQTPDVLFKALTLPLLMVAASLQVRENKLIDLISKKDAEIFEYKREGVTIKRSHAITKVFNVEEMRREVEKETKSTLSEIKRDVSSVLNVVDASLFPLHVDEEIANCRDYDQSEESNGINAGVDSVVKSDKTNVKESEMKKRRKTDGAMKNGKVRRKIPIQIRAVGNQARGNVRVSLKF